MKPDVPTILHHKYSLEDGHVTAQISKIEGYRGIMLTRHPSRIRSTPLPSMGSQQSATLLSLKAIKKKPSLLRKGPVVGVHIHHGTLAPKFLFLKEKYGIPMFVGFRGKDATGYPKKKNNLKLLQRLFQTADMFFPVCEHLKKEIMKLGCPEDKIRVLYGGVDLERFECRPRHLDPEKKIRFLAVGRFVEKKGFDDLIRAFGLVRKRHPSATLLLIGKGPCEALYRQLIQKYKLNGIVQIKPWVDYQSIHKKYYKSHIFVAPSCTDQEGNQEGIPNTLKEAMATGMPVVSTYHAGIPELIEDRVSGLLVPEKSVIELAKAMNWLVEHPKVWEELGRSARGRVEIRFHLQTQLAKQKKFYDQVIKER
jgi:colanic acid/amylovoran biosynthesis glycosyltransferase